MAKKQKRKPSPPNYRIVVGADVVMDSVSSGPSWFDAVACYAAKDEATLMKFWKFYSQNEEIMKSVVAHKAVLRAELLKWGNELANEIELIEEASD